MLVFAENNKYRKGAGERGLKDNPRFGLNSWHKSFQGDHEDYKLGDNLCQDGKKRLVNIPTGGAR